MHFNEENLRPDRRSVISSEQVQIELNCLGIGVDVKPTKQPYDMRIKIVSIPTWMAQTTHSGRSFNKLP